MYVFMYPPHWLEAGVDCGHLSNRFSYLVVVGVCWETPDCVHQAVVKKGSAHLGKRGEEIHRKHPSISLFGAVPLLLFELCASCPSVRFNLFILSAL